MKTKDLKTIGAVALGTATLTVVSFWSGPLEAGHEAAGPSGKIAIPRLVSHGVELTVGVADGQTFQAGDEPCFTLQAVNLTDQAATVNVRLAMTSAAPADQLSRVIRLPSVLWQHRQSIVLGPRETKTVPLATHTKLPRESLVAVTIEEADATPATRSHGAPLQPALQQSGHRPGGIVALRFSTSRPAPAVALGR